MGATFTGEALALSAPGARSKPFASPTDLLADTNKVERIALDLPHLRYYLTDPNVLLLRIGMTDALGIAPYEVATYSFILPQSVGVDTHPLVIWSTGEALSGPDMGVTKASRRVGEKVYDRFLAFVKRLSPAYAAITVEYSLECPTDLRYDSRSYAFRDFFVSEEYAGRSNLRQIQEVFEDAYVEAVGKGIYLSSVSAFNPLNKGMNSQLAVSKSAIVAKIIASIG